MFHACDYLSLGRFVKYMSSYLPQYFCVFVYAVFSTRVRIIMSTGDFSQEHVIFWLLMVRGWHSNMLFLIIFMI